ncbi:Rossmann-like and DUF2520 domain-containing protein [Flavobacterium lindanitolerans]|uniref:Short-subunit dehydrogenase-like oxidoreductase (DUF2520 family) n=1 Tax=Flavobacterium lindanitolerans TaxID=428988 RepID=A0A497UUW4_9FLAO|nr:Rossmann-like and DUF2520 domain-containing protein [Flavobacterium lindanitolerans]PKW20917.1 putative short-subunit dehydrogenase-like oxidoreductase (DUF2520 family) [Flavobacterium lindanitolerans]RLJ30444.1 putative short-subunit dehydrogenase-like oxidoreductase (DUF2520 family) [Flavobacterium lindanitolerans]
MIRATIIGSGNVAQHLIHAFKKSNGIELSQVFSRQKESLSHLVEDSKIINDHSQFLEADIYIIAVSDSAVAEVSSSLPFENRLVVHTSGSVPLSELHPKNRRGVFYPLQTFTKNKEVDFSTLPICMESEFDDDYTILENVAEAIGSKHYLISSDQRKSLHVAAVFVNNFTNHLYQIGKEICAEHQLPFEILKPLIAETANKVQHLSPLEAQTGPAKRNDLNTIQAHLALLTDNTQKEIYKILTHSIQQSNVKKL